MPMLSRPYVISFCAIRFVDASYRRGEPHATPPGNKIQAGRFAGPAARLFRGRDSSQSSRKTHVRGRGQTELRYTGDAQGSWMITVRGQRILESTKASRAIFHGSGCEFEEGTRW